MTTDALVNNAGTPRIHVKSPGMQGPPGRVNFANSAYQEWLDAGYVGTVEDFFDFIRGAQGPQGEQGIQGEPGVDGTNGVDGADGADGAPGAPGDPGEPVPHYMDIITLAGPYHSQAVGHDGNLLEISYATAAVYHIDATSNAAIPIGSVIHLVQAGNGQLSVTWDDVTVKHGLSFDPICLEKEAIMVLVKTAAMVYRLGGALKLAGT